MLPRTSFDLTANPKPFLFYINIQTFEADCVTLHCSVSCFFHSMFYARSLHWTFGDVNQSCEHAERLQTMQNVRHLLQQTDSKVISNLSVNYCPNESLTAAILRPFLHSKAVTKAILLNVPATLHLHNTTCWSSSNSASSNLSKNSEGMGRSLDKRGTVCMCSVRRQPTQTSYYALSKLKEIQKRADVHARSNLYRQKITVKANWDYSLPFDKAGGKTFSALCFVLWRQAVNARTHCIPTSTFSFQPSQNSK